MKKLFNLFLATALFAAALFTQAYANTDTENPHLPISNEVLLQDLEKMLVSHNQLVGEMGRDNLSLIDAAIKYQKEAAGVDFLASMFFSFFATKNFTQPIALYAVNAKVIFNAVKGQKSVKAAREALKKLELKSANATTTLSAFGVSAAISVYYISTSLFQNGICIYSCVDRFSDRVILKRQNEFLTSPTYRQIEKELGKDKALRYFSAMKMMRDNNFSDFMPLINFLQHDLDEGRLRNRIGKYTKEGAPVFSETIRTFVRIFNLKSLVHTYLESTPEIRQFKQDCPDPKWCT